MLQIIQYQKTGEMFVEEVPVPLIRGAGVLVRNVFSLISAGTEISVETARASMLGKAKLRPDLVKQVRDNIRREGLLATYKKVQTRLDNYKDLGYSSAGIVMQSSVPEFKPGDRVACAGAGYASHAEVIFVPKNLAVKLPDNVAFEEAAFAALGSIALQGVRQTEVSIGEFVAVIGLGLVGLITVQLLKANGCRVVGLDVSPANFDLAGRLGCDDCVVSDLASIEKVQSFTRGYGTDAVIVTAGTTSNEPVELSLRYARKRSRIVIVGAVKMDFPRSPFYEKELEVRQSCSYGPGRYDPQYEEEGHDYPIAYVRWTENRNMGAVLDLMAQKKLDVRSLVTHTYPIADSLKAYDTVTGKTGETCLGILIAYRANEQPDAQARRVDVSSPAPAHSGGVTAVGFIGAGNYAQSYLIPPLKNLNVLFKGVATSKSVNAKSVSRKFGFEYCSTEPMDIIEDGDTDAVFVASRHDSHARYVTLALTHHKPVFVEKPLCVNESELREILNLYDELTSNGSPPPLLMVGFNRRFSPAFMLIKEFFKERKEPLAISYRINAGYLPRTHWYQHPVNGGRIIGEVCHFIDALQYFSDALPVKVFAESIETDNVQATDADSVHITVKLTDGSIGTISYVANGDTALPKEFLEIFCENSVARLHNFKKVELIRQGKTKTRGFDGEKGQAEELRLFIEAVLKGTDSPIFFDSMVRTTLTTFKAVESLTTGKAVLIN